MNTPLYDILEINKNLTLICPYPNRIQWPYKQPERIRINEVEIYEVKLKNNGTKDIPVKAVGFLKCDQADIYFIFSDNLIGLNTSEYFTKRELPIIKEHLKQICCMANVTIGNFNVDKKTFLKLKISWIGITATFLIVWFWILIKLGVF